MTAADAPPLEKTLEITTVGARGDGLAHSARGVIYAALTLPGERVRARIAGDRAEIAEILKPSEARQAAACQHFGRCGGCQLQHWREAEYLAWKRSLVVDALSKRGLGRATVDATIAAWGEGRRRAAFHAARENGRVRIGFIERGGARLTPIVQCPALAPRLEAIALRLAPLAELALPPRGEITLQCLLTDAGVDVSIKGAARPRSERANLEKLSAAATELGLARLSIDGDLIVERAKPLVRLGRASVLPPPGAFLQPTVQGEETLAGLAIEAIGDSGRVIDLFSGIGTFALRAAERAEVLAVESETAMLDALKHAADNAGGALKQVTTLRRDLLRTPVSSLEMKKFGAAIIDPPRSGARLQIEQIARAPIRRVAYVSCDAPTFARDVKVLIDHGFSLARVTPVDQFRWSPHIEIVGALER
ncbi:MAG: class I SAM-dependent RNA methyltransferase [Proteobacteria bacterium]|nr:class I SAM-dependent RNA methyltransferase [Pseudomonadota bacterium]